MDYLSPIMNAVSAIRVKADLNARRSSVIATYENPDDRTRVVYTPINGLKLTTDYPYKSFYVIGFIQMGDGNGTYLCSDALSSFDVLSDLFWVNRSGRQNAWTNESKLHDMMLMMAFKENKSALEHAVRLAIQ